jgi:hypothetical protein
MCDEKLLILPTKKSYTCAFMLLLSNNNGLIN